MNSVIFEFERALDDKRNRLNSKIKQAAINRGCQLLLIRQVAEKLRKPKLLDTKPVSFDVEVARNPTQEAPPVQQRLEASEQRQTTIQEIVEKLAQAQMRRSQQREQTHKRLKRGCRRANRDNQTSLWTKISRKLAHAASLHTNKLQAVQIRAKLHNELVETRHAEAATLHEAQKLQKFSAIQAKLQSAAQKRD